jgi:hypothetical protein
MSGSANQEVKEERQRDSETEIRLSVCHAHCWLIPMRVEMATRQLHSPVLFCPDLITQCANGLRDLQAMNMLSWHRKDILEFISLRDTSSILFC